MLRQLYRLFSGGEEKFLVPAANWTPAVQPLTSHFTDCDVSWFTEFHKNGIS